jgi:CHAD domain-containing protein
VEAHVGRTGDAALRALLKRWVASKRTLAGSPAARERVLRNVARRMTTVVAKLEHAGGGRLTWEWLEAGLARGYRRGRRGWRRCGRGRNDLLFHAWRRRAKDLQYHLDLLRPLAPHRLGRLRRRVQKVAQALGDAHDLLELREALERAFAAVRDHGWSSALSGQRRDLLEGIQRAMVGKYRAALKEAEGVYRLPPKTWLRGLRKDWDHHTRKQGAHRRSAPRRAAKLT